MEMTIKARNKVDSLVKIAKKERDKKGYRENLGYDSIYKLEDYLETLSLSYSEKAEVTTYFHAQCDEI